MIMSACKVYCMVCCRSELAEVYGVSDKNIEIGHSMLTRSGVVTHVVHYVHDRDLNHLMRVADLSPRMFVEQMFQTLHADISNVLRGHFKLSEDFETDLQHRLLAQRRETFHESPRDEQKRATILRNVRSRIELEMTENVGDGDGAVTGKGADAKEKAVSALRFLFREQGIEDEDAKMRLLADLVKKM